jgi:sortase (surface protein transpeptidase)
VPEGRASEWTGPAAQSAEVAVLPESAPVRVQVPSIGVDSGLLDLQLQDDGTLEVPPDGMSAGWYTGSPTPGELGPAVIAGHVDWGGRPGVFYRLRDVHPGDEISVLRANSTVAVFRVSRVEQFPKDAFPTDVVYGDIDHAGLRLITCGGSFDSRERSYDDNIVVFAEFDRVAPA